MTVRFFAPEGQEVPAVTAAQMREVDRIAVEETGPNLFQMMENAGRSLTLEVMERLGATWQTARVAVLAGRGGNGGGGICAARHLVSRGINIALCLAEPDRLGEIAAFQYRTYTVAGGRQVSLDGLEGERPALIVDALLGYNQVGPPQPRVATVIRWARSSGIPVLSLDVPSGVDATTGETPGEYLTAERTLTLALPKTGLRPRHTGEIILADLGIPRDVFGRIAVSYQSPFGSRFRVPLRMIGEGPGDG